MLCRAEVDRFGSLHLTASESEPPTTALATGRLRTSYTGGPFRFQPGLRNGPHCANRTHCWGGAMHERTVDSRSLLGEILRLARLIPLVLAGYAALSTGFYAYVDWHGHERALVYLGLLDWALIYGLTVLIMSEAGLFRSGKHGGVGAYFAYGIVSGLAILLGLMLFIVPGMILLARWQPAVCDVLIHNDGPTRAMERAWQATSGSMTAMLLHTFGAAACLAAGLAVWALPDEIYVLSPLAFIIGQNFAAAIGSLWLLSSRSPAIAC